MTAYEVGLAYGRTHDWASKRERTEAVRSAGFDPATDGNAVNEFRRGFDRANTDRRQYRRLMTTAALGPAPYWSVTAEHTAGYNTGHPCSCGVVDDPADQLDSVVAARTKEEAERIGLERLGQLVDEHEPCGCGRQDRVGTHGWWNSVSVSARPIAARELV